jgi:nitrogen fixation/metabolism regulation signal transduction histidine kinase
MPAKSFVKIFLSILALVGSVILCVISFLNGWNLITIISIIVVLVSITLILGVYKTAVRKIALMFDAIENDDFTFRFTGNSLRLQTDDLLNRSLNRIKNLVIEARQEVREQEKYFEHILNQVSTGIIIINEQGIVFNKNQYALHLLGLSQLTHIRQLSQISKGLDEQFFTLQERESRKVSFYNEVSKITLNITATFTNLQGKILKIIAFTNIEDDINETREESWKRMSSVLTHEIMNSLAPVTALSQSLLHTSDYVTLRKGLEIINDTAGGLTKFVENYRSITRIPAPQLQDFDLEMLIKNEGNLLFSEITVKINTSDTVILGDRGQISQVLVNLFKNANEAIIESDDKEAKIWVEIGRNVKGGLFVDVCNNGIPISDENRENIFVPFFTTKESGNGIGLSISRQIMRLHGGTLTLSTKPFTRFRMQF